MIYVFSSIFSKVHLKSTDSPIEELRSKFKSSFFSSTPGSSEKVIVLVLPEPTLIVEVTCLIQRLLSPTRMSGGSHTHSPSRAVRSPSHEEQNVASLMHSMQGETHFLHLELTAV
jgi:hypothetical protein